MFLEWRCLKSHEVLPPCVVVMGGFKNITHVRFSFPIHLCHWKKTRHILVGTKGVDFIVYVALHV